MNIYRTMRLIPSIMKLLCANLTNRTQRGLEERNFLAPEQAGFRSREECMSHDLTFIEVVQRRSISCQQPTYVCFIDFQKAFDTVPHEAPFLKMERARVSGKCLAFFRALYADSWMCTRLGDCSRTPSIRIRRGLRQGDRASPRLFNIFINDLLNNCRQYGLEVSWIDCGEPGEERLHRNRLAGLLLADDVVLLAPAPETLAASMQQVSAWADRWVMNIGASKCGAMVILGDSQRIRNRSWRLQNQEIPIVEKYRYLGVCLTPTLDEKAQVDEMIAKMHRRTAIARPFLSDPSICIAIRTRALRMCIIQPSTWGAEWCGMKHTNASRLHTAANRAMRLVGVGCSVQRRATNPLALGLELQIASIEAIAAGCRARIWAKRPTVRTSLSRIFMQTPTHRKNTWMKSTQI